jgi:hypothetical protein
MTSRTRRPAVRVFQDERAAWALFSLNRSDARGYL